MVPTWLSFSCFFWKNKWFVLSCVTLSFCWRTELSAWVTAGCPVSRSGSQSCAPLSVQDIQLRLQPCPAAAPRTKNLFLVGFARPAPRYQTQKNINKCFLYVSLVVLPLLLPALTFHFLQSQASPFFFWCVCAGVATPHAAVGNDPGASLHDCQEGHQLLEFFFPTF